MSEKNNTKSILLLVSTIIFYVATVLPHETVGGFIGSFFKDAGRAVYDKTILMCLIAAVAIFSIFILRSLYLNKERRAKGFVYLIVTVLLSVMALKMLIVINVEVVHFLQYGTLAILVFHLVKRYDYTCWIIFLMAFADESYQHFYLTPNRFQYLDFNDMLLDQIGCGFGLSAMYCLNKKSGPKNTSIRNGIIGVYALLILSGIVLYLTGTMRIWPGEDGELAKIQIFQKEVSGYWQTVRKVIQFHIMRPLESIGAFLIMIFFYSQLDE